MIRRRCGMIGDGDERIGFGRRVGAGEVVGTSTTLQLWDWGRVGRSGGNGGARSDGARLRRGSRSGRGL